MYNSIEIVEDTTKNNSFSSFNENIFQNTDNKQIECSLYTKNFNNSVRLKILFDSLCKICKQSTNWNFNIELISYKNDKSQFLSNLCKLQSYISSSTHNEEDVDFSSGRHRVLEALSYYLLQLLCEADLLSITKNYSNRIVSAIKAIPKNEDFIYSYLLNLCSFNDHNRVKFRREREVERDIKIRFCNIYTILSQNLLIKLDKDKVTHLLNKLIILFFTDPRRIEPGTNGSTDSHDTSTVVYTSDSYNHINSFEGVKSINILLYNKLIEDYEINRSLIDRLLGYLLDVLISDSRDYRLVSSCSTCFIGVLFFVLYRKDNSSILRSMTTTFSSSCAATTITNTNTTTSGITNTSTTSCSSCYKQNKLINIDDTLRKLVEKVRSFPRLNYIYTVRSIVLYLHNCHSHGENNIFRDDELSSVLLNCYEIIKSNLLNNNTYIINYSLMQTVQTYTIFLTHNYKDLSLETGVVGDLENKHKGDGSPVSNRDRYIDSLIELSNILISYFTNRIKTINHLSVYIYKKLVQSLSSMYKLSYKKNHSISTNTDNDTGTSGTTSTSVTTNISSNNSRSNNGKQQLLIRNVLESMKKNRYIKAKYILLDTVIKQISVDQLLENEPYLLLHLLVNITNNKATITSLLVQLLTQIQSYFKSLCADNHSMIDTSNEGYLLTSKISGSNQGLFLEELGQTVFKCYLYPILICMINDYKIVKEGVPLVNNHTKYDGCLMPINTESNTNSKDKDKENEKEKDLEKNHEKEKDKDKSEAEEEVIRDRCNCISSILTRIIPNFTFELLKLSNESYRFSYFEYLPDSYRSILSEKVLDLGNYCTDLKVFSDLVVRNILSKKIEYDCRGKGDCDNRDKCENKINTIDKDSTTSTNAGNTTTTTNNTMNNNSTNLHKKDNKNNRRLIVNDNEAMMDILEKSKVVELKGVINYCESLCLYNFRKLKKLNFVNMELGDKYYNGLMICNELVDKKNNTNSNTSSSVDNDSNTDKDSKELKKDNKDNVDNNISTLDRKDNRNIMGDNDRVESEMKSRISDDSNGEIYYIDLRRYMWNLYYSDNIEIMINLIKTICDSKKISKIITSNEFELIKFILKDVIIFINLPNQHHFVQLIQLFLQRLHYNFTTSYCSYVDSNSLKGSDSVVEDSVSNDFTNSTNFTSSVDQKIGDDDLINDEGDFVSTNHRLVWRYLVDNLKDILEILRSNIEIWSNEGRILISLNVLLSISEMFLSKDRFSKDLSYELNVFDEVMTERLFKLFYHLKPINHSLLTKIFRFVDVSSVNSLVDQDIENLTKLLFHFNGNKFEMASNVLTLSILDGTQDSISCSISNTTISSGNSTSNKILDSIENYYSKNFKALCSSDPNNSNKLDCVNGDLGKDGHQSNCNGYYDPYVDKTSDVSNNKNSQNKVDKLDNRQTLLNRLYNILLDYYNNIDKYLVRNVSISGVVNLVSNVLKNMDNNGLKYRNELNMIYKLLLEMIRYLIGHYMSPISDNDVGEMTGKDDRMVDCRGYYINNNFLKESESDVEERSNVVIKNRNEQKLFNCFNVDFRKDGFNTNGDINNDTTNTTSNHITSTSSNADNTSNTDKDNNSNNEEGRRVIFNDRTHNNTHGIDSFSMNKSYEIINRSELKLFNYVVYKLVHELIKATEGIVFIFTRFIDDIGSETITNTNNDKTSNNTNNITTSTISNSGESSITNGSSNGIISKKNSNTSSRRSKEPQGEEEAIVEMLDGLIRTLIYCIINCRHVGCNDLFNNLLQFSMQKLLSIQSDDDGILYRYVYMLIKMMIYNPSRSKKRSTKNKINRSGKIDRKMKDRGNDEKHREHQEQDYESENEDEEPDEEEELLVVDVEEEYEVENEDRDDYLLSELDEELTRSNVIDINTRSEHLSLIFISIIKAEGNKKLSSLNNKIVFILIYILNALDGFENKDMSRSSTSGIESCDEEDEDELGMKDHEFEDDEHDKEKEKESEINKDKEECNKDQDDLIEMINNNTEREKNNTRIENKKNNNAVDREQQKNLIGINVLNILRYIYRCIDMKYMSPENVVDVIKISLRYLDSDNWSVKNSSSLLLSTVLSSLSTRPYYLNSLFNISTLGGNILDELRIVYGSDEDASDVFYYYTLYILLIFIESADVVSKEQILLDRGQLDGLKSLLVCENFYLRRMSAIVLSRYYSHIGNEFKELLAIGNELPLYLDKNNYLNGYLLLIKHILILVLNLIKDSGNGSFSSFDYIIDSNNINYDMRNHIVQILDVLYNIYRYVNNYENCTLMLEIIEIIDGSKIGCDVDFRKDGFNSIGYINKDTTTTTTKFTSSTSTTSNVDNNKDNSNTDKDSMDMKIIDTFKDYDKLSHYRYNKCRLIGLNKISNFKILEEELKKAENRFKEGDGRNSSGGVNMYLIMKCIEKMISSEEISIEMLRTIYRLILKFRKYTQLYNYYLIGHNWLLQRELSDLFNNDANNTGYIRKEGVNNQYVNKEGFYKHNKDDKSYVNNQYVGKEEINNDFKKYESINLLLSKEHYRVVKYCVINNLISNNDIYVNMFKSLLYYFITIIIIHNNDMTRCKSDCDNDVYDLNNYDYHNNDINHNDLNGRNVNNDIDYANNNNNKDKDNNVDHDDHNINDDINCDCMTKTDKDVLIKTDLLRSFTYVLLNNTSSELDHVVRIKLSSIYLESFDMINHVIEKKTIGNILKGFFDKYGNKDTTTLTTNSSNDKTTNTIIITTSGIDKCDYSNKQSFIDEFLNLLIKSMGLLFINVMFLLKDDSLQVRNIMKKAIRLYIMEGYGYLDTLSCTSTTSNTTTTTSTCTGTTKDTTGTTISTTSTKTTMKTNNTSSTSSFPALSSCSSLLLSLSTIDYECVLLNHIMEVFDDIEILLWVLGSTILSIVVRRGEESSDHNTDSFAIYLKEENNIYKEDIVLIRKILLVITNLMLNNNFKDKIRLFLQSLIDHMEIGIKSAVDLESKGMDKDKHSRVRNYTLSQLTRLSRTFI